MLEECHSKYPQLDKESLEHLALCKETLLAESVDKPNSPKKEAKIQRHIEREADAKEDE